MKVGGLTHVVMMPEAMPPSHETPAVLYRALLLVEGGEHEEGCLLGSWCLLGWLEARGCEGRSWRRPFGLGTTGDAAGTRAPPAPPRPQPFVGSTPHPAPASTPPHRPSLDHHAQASLLLVIDHPQLLLAPRATPPRPGVAA